MLLALGIAFSILVAYLTSRTIRQYYALKHFEGPWSSGISRLWLLWANSSGRMHTIFTDVNAKYGSTARIGPKILITSNAEVVKTMSAVRSPFTRSEWYTSLKLHPRMDHIASITDEALHSDFRSRMAPGYSGKENLHIEQDIDDLVLDLISLIERKYISSEVKFNPMDLAQKMTYFTLDVISKVAFGQPFGFLSIDNDPYGYIANLFEFLPIVILFGAYPELSRLLKSPLLKTLLPKATDKAGLGRVMGFAKERVEERFGLKPITRKDMLGSFINHGLNQHQLESETLLQITAGSDSTSTALRMTLYYITSNPAIHTRLLAETNQLITKGQISRPIIKDTEARQFPYLQACIKEGLRMYPPVQGLLIKQVPTEGTKIDNKPVPGGTWIAWNAWGIQRDSKIYGCDAEMCRPERWLPRNNTDAERHRLQLMNETIALVFGYGRFGCLGRGVATMELNKVVIEVLLRFNLRLVNPIQPFHERCLGFFLHTDMNFRITKRDEDDNRMLNGPVGLNGLQDRMSVDALPGAYET